MMFPVCAAVIIVIWRIDWRHDNEQRKRRVNQAAGEQDLQAGSQPSTYLPTYLPACLPAATLLDITYSLQLVNLLLLPSYIYLQS